MMAYQGNTNDDPLNLGGLDPSAIAETVGKKAKGSNEGPTAQVRAETAAKKEARLAAGKSASAGPSVAPSFAAPPPPPVDKSGLLDKIGRYRERFPELKSRNKVSVRSSLEEIEDEMHYIEGQLGAGQGNMGVQIFVAACSGLEKYNPLGLNLDGLGQVARDNSADFAPIIDELLIKYDARLSVGPEVRLCAALGQLVYTVHMTNSDPRARAAMEKAKQAAKGGGADL